MSFRKIIAIGLGIAFAGVAGGSVYLIYLSSNLPQIITVEDYDPLLVSEVYDRDGEKIGEFFREKRELVSFEKIPKVVRQAFIAAEDGMFYEHNGINYTAIFRALMANIEAGRKVQGGSTITQQVAKTLLLSSEKTYIRKLKEAILAYRIEDNLTKNEILYLYLNQIYLGEGAYGIRAAADTYFRKPLEKITAKEAALLAGLPQAPSLYSPLNNPDLAKERQRYVLSRMAEEDYITEAKAKEAKQSPVQVYVRKDYKKIAPYYLETVRQMLFDKLGSEKVLEDGLDIHTGLDLERQKIAQKQVRQGLRELDKRQGYRGPIKNLQEPEKIADFLLKSRNKLMDEVSPIRVLKPDGTMKDRKPLNLSGKDEKGNELPNIPHYIEIDQIVKGVVTDVDDKWGLVEVRFAESKGLIDFKTMKWAREPDPDIYYNLDRIEKPSAALKKGDVIRVKVVDKKFDSDRLEEKLSKLKEKKGDDYERPEAIPELKKFAELKLEQKPQAQGALISFDQQTEEIIAMVGGYSFEDSEFNRTIQAARQTGSSFKPIIYTAALDKDFTPATPIVDAPVVYGQDEADLEKKKQEQVEKWKPTNHSKSFSGDILFRNALIRSMNVPTVKVVEDIGVNWAATYARRLGIFSPLNMDYTLALGSSGVTPYEMTKVYSQLGRMGKRIRPIIINKVKTQKDKKVVEKMSLDRRFKDKLEPLREEFEKKRKAYLKAKDMLKPAGKEEKNQDGQEAKNFILRPQRAVAKSGEKGSQNKNKDEDKKLNSQPPIYFKDKEQLMRPETAYVVTSLLKGVIEEPYGTGRRAQVLDRPVAGKTGTTNGYYDGWFLGFTPDISTGVWVGFDKEKSLGKGEVGGRAALPIWIDYMKYAHENIPEKSFPVPDGVVFANIDNETGQLAGASSKDVVRQAFIEGTEPTEITDESNGEAEEQNFYKQDLSQ